MGFERSLNSVEESFYEIFKLSRRRKMLVFYEKRQSMIYQRKETRRLLAEELVDEDVDGVPK